MNVLGRGELIALFFDGSIGMALVKTDEGILDIPIGWRYYEDIESAFTVGDRVVVVGEDVWECGLLHEEDVDEEED